MAVQSDKMYETPCVQCHSVIYNVQTLTNSDDVTNVGSWSLHFNLLRGK